MYKRTDVILGSGTNINLVRLPLCILFLTVVYYPAYKMFMIKPHSGHTYSLLPRRKNTAKLKIKTSVGDFFLKRFKNETISREVPELLGFYS